MKPTLILGASDNPERYAYLATILLKEHGHAVYPLGLRQGTIEGTPILTGQPAIEGIDTVTMYMNAERQKPLYDYILSLHPKRIVFNPGAENMELERLAREQGIETERACTLVLLRTGQY